MFGKIKIIHGQILGIGGIKLLENMILIKDARLLDISAGFKYEKKDVLVKGDKIHAIEDNIALDSNMNWFKGEDYILSPGLIDIHTHVYPDRNVLGLNPDEVGINRGVTTVFDAGSQGPANFQDFHENVISKNKTNVFSFINLAKTGLEKERYEIADLSNIDTDMLKEVYHKYPQYIKGIKVRASASTVGDLGMKPIALAKKVSKELSIPLIVHIGNHPPKIDYVLSILEKGDVVTHTYHGKSNGIFENGSIKESFINARERGVLFDIGHGSSSFNFKIFKRAWEEGFYPDLISTDIYIQNLKGPVHSLQDTLNKLIGLGMTVEDCIYKVTSFPANIFNLNNLGSIKVGYKADLTLFKINKEEKIYVDSDENTLNISENIDIHYLFKNGELIEQDF